MFAADLHALIPRVRRVCIMHRGSCLQVYYRQYKNVLCQGGSFHIYIFIYINVIIGRLKEWRYHDLCCDSVIGGVLYQQHMYIACSCRPHKQPVIYTSSTIAREERSM